MSLPRGGATPPGRNPAMGSEMAAAEFGWSELGGVLEEKTSGDGVQRTSEVCTVVMKCTAVGLAGRIRCWDVRELLRGSREARAAAGGGRSYLLCKG